MRKPIGHKLFTWIWKVVNSESTNSDKKIIVLKAIRRNNIITFVNGFMACVGVVGAILLVVANILI